MGVVAWTACTLVHEKICDLPLASFFCVLYTLKWVGGVGGGVQPYIMFLSSFCCMKAEKIVMIYFCVTRSLQLHDWSTVARFLNLLFSLSFFFFFALIFLMTFYSLALSCHYRKKFVFPVWRRVLYNCHWGLWFFFVCFRNPTLLLYVLVLLVAHKLVYSLSKPANHFFFFS